MLEADTFCDNVSSSNMASACRIVSARLCSEMFPEPFGIYLSALKWELANFEVESTWLFRVRVERLGTSGRVTRYLRQLFYCVDLLAPTATRFSAMQPDSVRFPVVERSRESCLAPEVYLARA